MRLKESPSATGTEGKRGGMKKMKAARPSLVFRGGRGQHPSLMTSWEKDKMASRILSSVGL